MGNRPSRFRLRMAHSMTIVPPPPPPSQSAPQAIPFTLHSQTEVAPPSITVPTPISEDPHARIDRLEQRLRQLRTSDGSLLGRILMEHQWPVYRPSLGCLRLRDTWSLAVLASIWGFIVRLWGPMDWMRPIWLCFFLCPWVVRHNVGLLYLMYHATRLGMIWPRNFLDNLHLTLSLMFRGESWRLWGRGQGVSHLIYLLLEEEDFTGY